MAELDSGIVTMLVLVLCSSVIGIIGLVLGAIGLSQSDVGQVINVYTNSSSTVQPQDPASAQVALSSSGERVWLIAIGHFDNRAEYLDPVSYQIKGYDVDVVDAVCDIANKNCKLVNDIFENCWDSKSGQRARGGRGMMEGWYDACTGWTQTFARALTFSFTDDFQKANPVGIYVKIGTTNFDFQDLTNLKVAFVDGFAADEHCLARYSADGIAGLPLIAENIIHLPSLDDVTAAVNDGTVDAAFILVSPKLDQDLLRTTPDDFANRCAAGGIGMMTRKENVEFISWWNDGFSRLVGTKRYDDICQNLLYEHGDIPGDDPHDMCIGY